MNDFLGALFSLELCDEKKKEKLEENSIDFYISLNNEHL